MYSQKVTTTNHSEECGVCHSEVKNYISNFRIDINSPGGTLILGNDMFVSHICIGCLTDAMNAGFAELTPSKKSDEPVLSPTQVRDLDREQRRKERQDLDE